MTKQSKYKKQAVQVTIKKEKQQRSVSGADYFIG